MHEWEDRTTPIQLNVETIPEGHYSPYFVYTPGPFAHLAGYHSEDIRQILAHSEELSFLQQADVAQHIDSLVHPLSSARHAFENSNLMSAILCLIPLSISTVYPYYSEDYRNRTLFFPFMIILRAILCVCDLIYHALACLYYLATFQFQYAFGTFIQLLCDIVAPLIHLVVNLPVACASFILRPILTLIVGYQEKLLPHEGPRRALAPREWRGSKEMDVSLNALIYDTRNCFFRNEFHCSRALGNRFESNRIRSVRLTRQQQAPTPPLLPRPAREIRAKQLVEDDLVEQFVMATLVEDQSLLEDATLAVATYTLR